MSTESGLSFGAFCPSGGEWHTCANSITPFVGCCTSSPCGTSAGCPAADVRPVSYNATWQDQFRDQRCSESLPTKFYTCGLNTVPFVGCCSVNACDANECPQPNLSQMILAETNDDFRLPGPTFRDPSATASPSPSPSPSDNSSGIHLSKGAIIGIGVGAGIFVIALVLGVWLCMRRKRKEVHIVQPNGFSDAHAPFLGGEIDNNAWPSNVSHISPQNTPDMNQYNRYSAVSKRGLASLPTSPDPNDNQFSPYSPTLSPPLYHPSQVYGNARTLSNAPLISEAPGPEIGPPVELGSTEMDSAAAAAYAQKSGRQTMVQGEAFEMDSTPLRSPPAAMGGVVRAREEIRERERARSLERAEPGAVVSPLLGGQEGEAMPSSVRAGRGR